MNEERRERLRRDEDCVSKQDIVALDRVMSERWLAHGHQHESERRTVEQTRAQMDVRLSAMNEFRSSLSDVVSRTISREVFDAEMDAKDARIAALENFRSKAVGACAVLAVIAGVVGAAIMKALGG